MSQYRELMSTGKGLRAVARWVMSEGLLSQFSLAKEQIDHVEGRAREHDDNGADEEDPGAGVGVSRIFRPKKKVKLSEETRTKHTARTDT